MSENINSLRLQIDALTELLRLKNSHGEDDSSAVELYRRRLFQLLVAGRLREHEMTSLQVQHTKLLDKLDSTERLLLKKEEALEELQEDNNGLQATIFNLNNQ